MRNKGIYFTPLDAPYSKEPTLLYILTKINNYIVIDVMVDPTCQVDVIIEEALFINGWHKVRYDECRAFIHTHYGIFVPPLSNTILMVLLKPKVVSITFVIILELDLLHIKLGIPWLITMK